MVKRLVLVSVIIGVLSLSSVVVAASGCCDCDPGDDISKTFFSVRPHFQSFSPEKDVLFRDAMAIWEDDRHNGVEITVFGGRSRDEDSLARYFLPSGRSSILVASDSAENVADRDVDAKHLNIDHDDGAFESCVSFCPRQEVIGVGFHYRQWFSRSSERGFWFSVSLPVVRVENSINMCETIKNEGDVAKSTRVENVTEAFKQSDWCFGKIDDCCCMRSTRVADVEFKFGWQALHTDDCHAETYIGFVAPTGDRPSACYLFEPIVGNNHHWVFMGGATIAVRCWSGDEKSISCYLEYNRRYLFENEQKRMFDLKNKPWSRYMEVYKNQDAAVAANTASGEADPEEAGDHGAPGVNFFTRCAKVKPGFATTVNSSFVFVGNGLHAEFGYTFAARQKEEIEICQCYADDEAVALVGHAQSGATTKARMIKDNFAGTTTTSSVDESDTDNYSDAVIGICDLDASSAAHPAHVSHALHGSLGYSWDERDYPPSIGVGASYEFGSNNKTLDRWTVWGKLGLAF